MNSLRTVLSVLSLLLLLGLLIGLLGNAERLDLGEVLVRAGGYNLHATLPGALLLLGVSLALLWLLWRLLSAPFLAWGRHRRKRARAKLIEGLEALHGGHWQRAEKLLVQAAEDDEVGVAALLGATHAASARDDQDAVQQHLAQLAARHPAAHALVRAERALSLHQADQAVAALNDTAAQPLPPRGLSLLAEALAANRQAGEAYGLLGALKQQRALTPAAFAALEARLAVQSLQEAGDGNALAERWDGLPKHLRSDAAVVAAYATRAAALHWDDAATRSIEQALETRWDESLAALYGRLPIDKTDSRRASAQRWLVVHPDSPALLLTLGRLEYQQGQWPQARQFLERAIEAGAGAEAWEALGHGFAGAGDTAQASRSYANALRVRDGAAPESLPVDIETVADPLQATLAGREERDENGVPRLGD